MNLMQQLKNKKPTQQNETDISVNKDATTGIAEMELYPPNNVIEWQKEFITT